MNPTNTTTFDRRIADWLAGDPSEAPETVLSSVLKALPTVRQRRVAGGRWPTRGIGRQQLAAVLGGVALMVLLIVAVSLVAQERATVGASPSAYVPPRTTFTSDLYGYSLTHTSGIRTYAGETAWTPGQPWHIRWVADTFEGQWRRFSVVSTRFPVGTSVTDWIDRSIKPGSGPCPDAPAGTWNDGSVAGHEARIRIGRCVVDAVVVVAERVYVLSWRTSQPGPDGGGDRLLSSFEDFADTIQFDPGAAAP
jgi:hypothetical protein